MQKLFVLLMLTIGLSSVGLALSGSHGQRFDWQQLTLSAQQANDIELIQQDYYRNFQFIRKQMLTAEEKTKALLVLRRDQVMAIEKVLDDDQITQARSLMLAAMEKREFKRLKRISNKLALRPEQEQAVSIWLQDQIASLQDELIYGDLSAIETRQSLMEQLNVILPAILSEQQLAQWQIFKQGRDKFYQYRALT